MAKYKQKCAQCKKNYVLVTGRQFPICYDCQKTELAGKVSDPKMKRMFSIPEKYYKENSFLRSIKINYLKFGSLSEKQIDAFKKTVKEMKSAPST